jgi:hypothetical protein
MKLIKIIAFVMLGWAMISRLINMFEIKKLSIISPEFPIILFGKTIPQDLFLLWFFLILTLILLFLDLDYEDAVRAKKIARKNKKLKEAKAKEKEEVEDLSGELLEGLIEDNKGEGKNEQTTKDK